MANQLDMVLPDPSYSFINDDGFIVMAIGSVTYHGTFDGESGRT